MSEREIPAGPGSYLLALRIDVPICLEVGHLGNVEFKAGLYVYAGSAHGPGGLRARLSRHLHGEGHLHWHIDWLRRAAQVEQAAWQSGMEGLECVWSQSLARLPGAEIPRVGFGASDCRSGCPAHLIVWAGQITAREVFQTLQGQVAVEGGQLFW